MSEHPTPHDPDEQARQELIDYNSGFNEDFIPPDSAFHPAYAAAKAKGILTGYQFGLEETAKDAAREKARAEREAQRAEQEAYRADNDPLTDMLNKAAFKVSLSKKFEELGVGNLGILFIDLKDFKKANDKHGHEYGDEILTTTATILKSVLRTQGEHTDTVSFESEEERKKAGRLGGDEFAVIVDLTPRQDAEKTPEERLVAAGERLRSAFETNDTIRASGVGMSLGGAIWEGQAVDELLKQADAAMYEDKRAQQEKDGSYR